MCTDVQLFQAQCVLREYQRKGRSSLAHLLGSKNVRKEGAPIFQF